MANRDNPSYSPDVSKCLRQSGDPGEIYKLAKSSRITPEHRNIFTGVHRGLNRNNGTYALRVTVSNSVVTVTTTPVVSANRKQVKAATGHLPSRPVRPALGRARRGAGPWHALHVRHVRPRTPKPTRRAATRDCDRTARERTKTARAGSGWAADNTAIHQRQPRRVVAGEAWRHRGLVHNDVGLKRKQKRENEETNAHILLMLLQIQCTSYRNGASIIAFYLVQRLFPDICIRLFTIWKY